MRLLGRRQLPAIAEHIDPGKGEGTVGTHHFSADDGLIGQGFFPGQMAGEKKVVLPAPCADLVRICCGEPFCNMVVKAITCRGITGVRQLPYNLGKSIEEITTVLSLITLRKIIGVWQNGRLICSGRREILLPGELRLVGEDSGNGMMKFFTDRVKIFFVSRLEKLSDRGGIERVQIGHIVKPWFRSCKLAVNIQFPIGFRDGVLSCDAFVMEKFPCFIQLHRITAQQFPGLFCRAGLRSKT